MTDEQIALARRAVACKGFRWMPGMRTDSGLRLVVVWGTYNTASVLSDGIDDAHSETVSLVDELPDLTDPATVGCLLALVREVWGDHATSFANGYEEPQKMWSVYNGRINSDDYGHEIATGSTEAEALVAALEAAPQ